MVRGSIGRLVSRSLSVAGKWQQQQLRRLNIHEYQYGINVPKGVAVSSVDDVKDAIESFFPNENEVVVKSQNLAAGRGLGTFKSGLKGGVHIVKTEEVEDLAGKMLGQILVTKETGPQGKVVSKVYLCEKLSLVNEMYFAITLDRKTTGPLIIACSKGGSSIEDLAEKYPDMIIKGPLDVSKRITDEDAAKVVDGVAAKVADRNACMEQTNPMAETSADQLVAADAKFNFDDSAAFRHKEASKMTFIAARKLDYAAVPSVLHADQTPINKHGNILWHVCLDRVVFITGTISDSVASDVVAQLLFLDSADSVDSIVVLINSPGGSIEAIFAVYDIMQQIRAPLITICMGRAASFSSLLLAAGTPGRRYAMPNAGIMMQQIFRKVSGTASDIAIQLDEIDRVSACLYAAYAKHTGRPFDHIKKAMERTLYLSPEEAKHFGLLDVVM